MVVGVSIGIVMSTGPEQNADDLLSNADVAMYTAKAQGRRQYAVFDPTLHAAVIARHELSGELTRGIDRGELVVLYQPIVDLDTRRTVGMEALVRWRHPTRGLVKPEEFISLAEESGSIGALGSYVLEEAIAALRRLPVHGTRRMRGLFISVNVSPMQLQAPDFLDEVERVLEESALRPGQLVLEITESAMFRDSQATIAKLLRLRERGVRIAIDDFGTGYASLTYLRRFPVDIIKIAQEFIARADADNQEWAFTGAILALGQRLGLEVVAEGVEDQGQVERLIALGLPAGPGLPLRAARTARGGVSRRDGRAGPPTPGSDRADRRTARRAELEHVPALRDRHRRRRSASRWRGRISNLGAARVPLGAAGADRPARAGCAVRGAGRGARRERRAAGLRRVVGARARRPPPATSTSLDSGWWPSGRSRTWWPSSPTAARCPCQPTRSPRSASRWAARTRTASRPPTRSWPG